MSHFRVVLDELLQAIEHLSRVATVHEFSVLLHSCRVFGFHTSQELDLALEGLISGVAVTREVKFHMLDASAVSQHVSEGCAASLSPQLLGIIGLFDRQFFQTLVRGQDAGNMSQAFVGQDTDIQALDV